MDDNSILNSIKHLLGPETDYTHFDRDIILHINSVLGILFQMGVGPKDKPFKITGASETWDQFIEKDKIETVKSYIFAKVKLLFDPPSSSYVLSSYKDLADEMSWRSSIDAETP